MPSTGLLQHEQGRPHPVCIVKDLGDLLALGRLTVADHVVRADDLDKGELRLQAQGRCQGSFACPAGPFKQAGQQGCGLAAPDLRWPTKQSSLLTETPIGACQSIMKLPHRALRPMTSMHSSLMQDARRVCKEASPHRIAALRALMRHI